jgi:hypothetical protein
MLLDRGTTVSELDVQLIVSAIHKSFYMAWDFWINFILGIAGVVFAVLAFIEARAAKEAAKHAGRSVKIQTVALELMETLIKLDRLEPDIKYKEARDLLTETGRKITRSVAPFAMDEGLKDSIGALRLRIEEANTALNDVRPTTPLAEQDAPQAVYNAIEAHFSRINSSVAHLVGLLEMQTSNFGN